MFVSDDQLIKISTLVDLNRETIENEVEKP